MSEPNDPTFGREVPMRPQAALSTTQALAALAAACSSSSRAVRGPVLPFIEDDYAQALSVARAKKLPLFVESWAPW